MLEKFQKVLEEFRKNKDKELFKFSLDTTQEYFEMEDTNKWLKFNVINRNQLENVNRFEEHFNELLKKLYVPDYPSKNV